MKQWWVQCRDRGMNLKISIRLLKRMKQSDMGVELIMIFSKRKQILCVRKCESICVKITWHCYGRRRRRLWGRNKHCSFLHKRRSTILAKLVKESERTNRCFWWNPENTTEIIESGTVVKNMLGILKSLTACARGWWSGNGKDIRGRTMLCESLSYKEIHVKRIGCPFLDK